jgi:hypothetical protein
LQTNHHISKYARIGRFNKNGLFDIVWSGSSALYPVPWNQYIKETNGKICNNALPGGSQITPPQVSVGLQFRPEEQSVLYAQLLAIDEINYVLGGINKMLVRLKHKLEVVPTILNLKWNTTTLNAAIPKSAVAIFGSSLDKASTASWGTVSAQLDSSALTIYPPPVPAIASAKNTIMLGLTVPQMLNNSLDWMAENHFDGYYIIGAENDDFTVKVVDFTKAKWAGVIPFINSRNLIVGDAVSNKVILTQMVSDISTSGMTRIAVINTFPGFDSSSKTLFDLLKTLSIQHKVLSTSIAEKHLTENMKSHFAVSSYVSTISLPENSVFLSSFRARFGPQSIVTDAMAFAYNALIMWQKAAEIADSFDPTKVRVQLYRTPFSLATGKVKVELNNYVSIPYRIAQVSSVGSSYYYRTIVGIDDIVDLTTKPMQSLKEGDVGYFGPTKVPPVTTTTFRILTVAVATLLIASLFVAIGFILYNRKLMVIRHSGVQFLTLVMGGCIINLLLVYVLYPTATTSLLCIGEAWPMHVGFYIVFGALIQKCHLYRL